MQATDTELIIRIPKNYISSKPISSFSKIIIFPAPTVHAYCCFRNECYWQCFLPIKCNLIAGGLSVTGGFKKTLNVQETGLVTISISYMYISYRARRPRFIVKRNISKSLQLCYGKHWVFFPTWGLGSKGFWHVSLKGNNGKTKRSYHCADTLFAFYSQQMLNISLNAIIA